MIVWKRRLGDTVFFLYLRCGVCRRWSLHVMGMMGMMDSTWSPVHTPGDDEAVVNKRCYSSEHASYVIAQFFFMFCSLIS